MHLGSSWKQKGLMTPKESRRNTITQDVNIKTHTEQVFHRTNGAISGMDCNRLQKLNCMSPISHKKFFNFFINFCLNHLSLHSKIPLENISLIFTCIYSSNMYLGFSIKNNILFLLCLNSHRSNSL